MSPTSRFNPEEGADYGKCGDCGTSLATDELASAHMKETFKGGTSHSVRILNPSRERRVEREVRILVADKIQDAMDELYGLVEVGDATEAEIANALTWHSEFADAWQEYAEEVNA